MSESTDAIIAFGVDMGEDCENWAAAFTPEGEDHGFDEEYFENWIAEQAGVFEPTVEYAKDKAAWRAYYEAKRLAVEAYPVEIITHCHYEAPMYIVALRGTEQRASRGYARTFDLKTLSEIDEAKIEILRQFFSEHGLDWSEPTWLLFSYWG